MQLGYALCILLCVPLGDILERRTLSVALLACATFGLVAMAIAPGVTWLAIAGFVAGAATIVAQVLMPFAADLATPETRGRVVATVQTGLIIGTVYARATGGLIGAHFGWRMVFWFAAGITVISTVVLARILPLRKPHSTLTYPELLRSVVALTKEYPVLRASMGLGFFAFVTFSAFWTTIAFHMKNLGYGSDVVGTLGLTALIGAFVAIPFGSLADKRGTVFTAAIAVIVLAVSFVIFLAGANSLVAFFAGMVLFPIGMQLNQISNQSRIFGLDEQARSRLNTAYMFTVFSGGAVGAFVSGIAWQWGGWSAVCGLSLVAIACAAVIVVWLRNHVALRAS